MIYHSKTLAKIFRTPYFPVSPYGLPIPMPVSCQIYYGEPLEFSGNGDESDELILSFAENYKTDDVLPGLYVYLTNNPNTINGALEIGDLAPIQDVDVPAGACAIGVGAVADP